MQRKQTTTGNSGVSLKCRLPVRRHCSALHIFQNTHMHKHMRASTLTLPLINSRVQTRARALIFSPLIWRGEAFCSRWLVHVSVATGATGLQQTSVLVMMVGGVGGGSVLGRGSHRLGGGMRCCSCLLRRRFLQPESEAP